MATYTAKKLQFTQNGDTYVCDPISKLTKSDITALGIPGQDTTYENATEESAGLMSAADKTKLDDIEAGAFFRTLGFNIAVNAWTEATVDSATVYQYTLSTDLVGQNTTIDIYYDASAYTVLNGIITAVQVSGGILFTTYRLPSDAVIGTIRVMGTSSNHKMVEVSSDTVPVSKGGTGAANAEGARLNLGLQYVENKSSATIRGEITAANIENALGFEPKDLTNGYGIAIAIDGSGKINHTNSVTEQTTQAVYPIKIDAQGHISSYGNAQTILTLGNTASTAAAGNHTHSDYAPKANPLFTGTARAQNLYVNATNSSNGTDIRVLTVSKTSVSSLPTTISNSAISANHIVVGSHLSNYAAKKSTWTITTADGSATIAGTISGTTDIYLLLAVGQ